MLISGVLSRFVTDRLRRYEVQLSAFLIRSATSGLPVDGARLAVCFNIKYQMIAMNILILFASRDTATNPLQLMLLVV